MTIDDTVPGEGWISDESSFYGDEDEQTRQLDLSDDFIPRSFWSAHHKDLNTVVVKAKLQRQEATLPAEKVDSDILPQTSSRSFNLSSLNRKAMEQEQLTRLGKRGCDSPHESVFPLDYELFNPRQGCHDSWQIGESVDDFIRRVPPLTTSVITCEWIWAINPHRNPHDYGGYSSVDDFQRRGSSLLADHLKRRNKIRAQGVHQPKAVVNRVLNEESKVLQNRIIDLAVKENVLLGKWMLFPKLEDVTRIWKLVVDGVINGRLGPVAKVAPDNGKDERLICIYTKDFRDEEDVRRVLQELDTIGLLTSGRPIYYKSDAYTYLDIYSNTANELGLQASLYSSSRMRV